MEQHKPFDENLNTKRQMFALIYSKGILHDDVLELYRKIRTGYEKILLNSNQMIELRELEHHLWRLHYELIDEFRKRIKPQSCRAENTKNNNPSDNMNSQSSTNQGLEGFKSFLSEATEFYRYMIVKLRRSCGLPPEIFLNDKASLSLSVEPIKLHACEHTCHRLLICVGDLARYAEIIKKPDACEWSVAATYYLEATRAWPDSGNPHNQLALLATYVGDSFLALYHCIRSLAVKEPFPDAWRNIMLLFEENRSTKLASVSSQMQLDFLNPSKRSYFQNTYQEENGSPHNSKSEDLDNVCSEKFDLWPILVRTMSFLLIRSSLEELPCTLASALHRLDALFGLDDTKLTTAMGSYQQVDSSRIGPYRAIQFVSIFIFVVHSLTESPEQEDLTGKDDHKHSITPLVFSAMFICMGRLTERCMIGNHKDICPLSPAVLIFVEWLVRALDTTATNDADERVMNALSYFFGALVDLLDRIKQFGKTSSLDRAALWEDHELKGFHPLIHCHETLDFTIHLECMDDYRSRNENRFYRITHAATRILEKSRNSRDWISHDKGRTLLSNCVKNPEWMDQGEVKENRDDLMNRSQENEEKPVSVENQPSSGSKTQPTIEEEEVILFKPITRRNSAPLYISKPTSDPVCPNESQTVFADEWLRRATSLSSHQSTEDGDSFSFCSTTSDSGQNRPLEQKEILLKDSTTHPTGPPSLSAWVLSKGSSRIEREKEVTDFSKKKLSPIEEIPSTSFIGLSIKETDVSQVARGHISTIVHDSSPYVTPTPSAPLLPEDTSWLRVNSVISPEYKTTIGHEADGILGAAPISSYTGQKTIRPPTGFVPGLSGFVDGYPQLLGMSSSEWLYHYRNSQNMPGNHGPLMPTNAPTYGNSHANGFLGFDILDQWGNHLVSDPMLYWGGPELYSNSSLGYGVEEQKREKFGYEKPFSYVCGVGMEPPLLQYLKEKERQLQPGSQLRDPTFM